MIDIIQIKEYNSCIGIRRRIFMLLTSTELSEKWNISARRISLLCSEGRLEGAFKKGKTWLIPDNIPKPVDSRIKSNEKGNSQLLCIQNRRYLGNKYRLLGFIEETIEKHCPGVESLYDVFAGTGVVAYHFMERMQVVTNDILYSNYLAHIAFMSNERVSKKKINDEIKLFNSLNADELEDNYMSVNFGDTYFSYNDCKKIGFAREHVQQLLDAGEINQREFAVLVTVILYAMDRVANTCGHYDAYRKGVKFERNVEFIPLDLERKPKGKNVFFNGDSNELTKLEDFPEVDCVYCDPPYNSRNYCDLYHVLENVAKWEKPEVTGVARKMDRSALKSKYCGKSAAAAFDDLVQHLKCKYIILSYNNTGDSADDRSNARMSDEEILDILSRKGKVKVYSKKYKAFTTGKSENDTNEERLFVCTVSEKKPIDSKNIVKSPLNYTGGKTKLLPQILPLFPAKIDTFLDMFCGGANVGINIEAKRVIYNDANQELIGLFRTFQKYTSKELTEKISEVIKKFNLSQSDLYGYEKYGCNSADGLGGYNKEHFIHLRDEFNSLKEKNDEYYIMLYVLIVFAFNNQIRFNRKHEFNLPVGKRDFNKNIRRNFITFVETLSKQNCLFESKDFRNIDISNLKADDFVYCDPPYLITTASYNEQDGWTGQDEKDLLDLLDNLNSRGVKFALSNVTVHKGRKNELLVEWAKKYKVHNLSFNYNNSNYHGKNNDQKTQEVLITNY